MVRAIDGQALLVSLRESYWELRDLCEQTKEDDEIKAVYQGELNIFIEAILRVKGMPTLDYVPVRHGRWIPVWKNLFAVAHFKCSVCGTGKRKQDGLIATAALGWTGRRH